MICYKVNFTFFFYVTDDLPSSYFEHSVDAAP
jgi:hypothetical protein